MASLTDRMVRAARLDSHLYEEVEADQTAMRQAMIVVMLAAAAGGIAAMAQTGSFFGLVVGVIASLLAWYIWAFLTYFIGTKILPTPGTQADFGQLLRTIGFSAAPGVIRVVGIVPALAYLSTLVASLWSLIAMVVAVRQALDYSSTWRAVAVCSIGWLVQILVLAAAIMFLGGEVADTAVVPGPATAPAPVVQ